MYSTVSRIPTTLSYSPPIPPSVKRGERPKFCVGHEFGFHFSAELMDLTPETGARNDITPPQMPRGQPTRRMPQEHLDLVRRRLGECIS